MTPVISQVQRGFEAARGRAVATLDETRRRSPWFAHMARAYERYQERRGDRLAAALTYFGFLSFFPLLALAYALLGYLVGASSEARTYLVDAINSTLPGLADDIPIEQIAQAKQAAGIIGLVGLLVAGLGWVGALRESLREIWGNDPVGGKNFFIKKLLDVLVLVFIGVMLILSVAAGSVATSASHEVLEGLRLTGTPGAESVLRVLSLAVAVGFDTLIFLVLFTRLSGTLAPWSRVIRGALLGAVGVEVLKLVATLLVRATTNNPVYASFAVIAGLLLWINIVSRYLLFAAAWTATRRVILSADEDNPEQEPRRLGHVGP